MKRTVVSIGLTIALSVSAQGTSIVDETSFLETRKIVNPSALHLQCQFQEGAYYTSKVALIKTKDDRFDYGLSTGHGLSFEGMSFSDDCRVVDHQGQSHYLKALYVPHSFSAGSSSDWALIRLPKIKDESIVRFQLPVFKDKVDQSFQDQSQTINFPVARGIGRNAQICQSYPGDYMGLSDPNLLVHDCRVQPGQSGSPVSIGANEDNLLIGLHLGRGFILRSKITGKADLLGYYRFIDNNMVEEIDIIISRHFN